MHAPTLLSSPPTPLAEWKLQVQIQQALSNKLTGLIQVNFINGRTESILVRNGTVQSLHIRNHRLPNLNWDIPLGRFGRGTLVIEPLPARALIIQKVMIEEITPPRPQVLGTHQLKTMFDLAVHTPNPTLFHMRWDRAEGFVLVAGSRIPVHHAVLVTASGAEEGTPAFDHITEWEETRCTLTTYHGDIKNQAWLELHLNILFEWYCQRILNYYKHITGAVMVRSILQSLSVIAEIKGWNISTQDQQLRDTSIFPSAAITASVYREILSGIRTRIEPVIGGSLTQNLLKQSIEPTKGIYKVIQESFELVEGVQ